MVPDVAVVGLSEPFLFPDSPSALAALANLWTHAARKSAVNADALKVDVLLESDPLGNAERNHEELYGLNVNGLRVTYTIDFPRHLVEVVGLYLER